MSAKFSQGSAAKPCLRISKRELARQNCQTYKMPHGSDRRDRTIRPSRTTRRSWSSTWALSTRSTHGVLRLVVELDGEIVRNACRISATCTPGIEKTMENLTYYKALVCTDREDYLSNLINNLAYCLAVEKLLDIDIPPRAHAIALDPQRA